MKHFLEIVDSYWVENNKMIHKSKDGELYKGDPLPITANSILIVEVSEGKMEDGYYHIIKLIGSVKKK